MTRKIISFHDLNYEQLTNLYKATKLQIAEIDKTLVPHGATPLSQLDPIVAHRLNMRQFFIKLRTRIKEAIFNIADDVKITEVPWSKF